MIRRMMSVLAPAALALATLLMVTDSASAFRGRRFGYYGGYYSPYYGGYYGGYYRPYYFGYGGYGGWGSPYYQGYSNYYYSPTSYSSNYAYPSQAGNPAYAYGAFSANGSTGANITVRVPSTALVWFDNERTLQTGSLRTFSSPPLDPNRNLWYTVRARWMEGDRTIERTKKIAVHNGEQLTVDFTAR